MLRFSLCQRNGLCARAGTRIGLQAAMPEAVSGLDEAALADLAYYLAHYRTP